MMKMKKPYSVEVEVVGTKDMLIAARPTGQSGRFSETIRESVQKLAAEAKGLNLEADALKEELIASGVPGGAEIAAKIVEQLYNRSAKKETGQ